MPRPWPRLRGIVAVALLPALLPGLVHAQDLTVASAATIARSDSAGDSIDIVPGAKYQAGGLHRMLLGTGYRDLWATPLRVPVLDLKTFGGGLRPLQKSGGNQTKSLRFVTPSGTEYVFRSVDKEAASFPEGFKGTVVQTIAKDQVSSHFPAGALVAPPILQAGGVLHVTPKLVVMPDDPRLGEYQLEYANILGMIEVYPTVPEHARGFAGAVAIIDSDSLLTLIDGNSAEVVDARALLTARLLDMMINDWDRHQGQWKWARLESGPAAPWVPIARDRDKALISYGGTLPGMARMAHPNLMKFEPSYPSMRGLTWNSLPFDRRMLSGLDRPVFDSIARTLVARVTDSVIDAAVSALPPEYQSTRPQLAHVLKLRRDSLPLAAERFYLLLAPYVDIHASDMSEHLEVTRGSDSTVKVLLRAADGTVTYARRFDRTETREIRVYLHGGNDTALVTGDVDTSIPVRIIGGNGSNWLLDSSRVAGSTRKTHLYDEGTVTGISYGPDTLYDRRPWVKEGDKTVPPGRDYGSALQPGFGFAYGDLGFLFGVGVSSVRYGFRQRPYASRVGLNVEYSTEVDAFRAAASGDWRRESSPLHAEVLARVSMLQVINFFGFGNTTAGDPGAFYEARQRQWLLQPAIVLDLGAADRVSFGPVLQYSTSDSIPGTFITSADPYGFGDFGQVGLRVDLRHDTRQPGRSPTSGLRADLGGSFFPAVWDVQDAFGSLEASGTAYVTLPIPVHPILFLRAGGRKVFGEYPWSEAAFIGGASTVRTLVLQRYAGDASLYGTTELRIPVARFPLVVPFDVGLFGFLDAGRVWLGGESPGAWHTATGAGLWIGIVEPSTGVSIAWTNTSGDTAVLIRALFAF